MGKMIFTVLGAVAELERNLIKERIQMGQFSGRSGIPIVERVDREMRVKKRTFRIGGFS